MTISLIIGKVMAIISVFCCHSLCAVVCWPFSCTVCVSTTYRSFSFHSWLCCTLWLYGPSPFINIGNVSFWRWWTRTKTVGSPSTQWAGTMSMIRTLCGLRSIRFVRAFYKLLSSLIIIRSMPLTLSREHSDWGVLRPITIIFDDENVGMEWNGMDVAIWYLSTWNGNGFIWTMFMIYQWMETEESMEWIYPFTMWRSNEFKCYQSRSKELILDCALSMTFFDLFFLYILSFLIECARI